MQLIISIFLAIMPAHAQPDTGAEACDDWGTIDQDGTIFEIIRAGSGQRTFSVLAPTCGDAEQCTWTLNGGNEIQKPGTLYKCGEEPGAEPITEFVGDEDNAVWRGPVAEVGDDGSIGLHGGDGCDGGGVNGGGEGDSCRQ